MNRCFSPSAFMLVIASLAGAFGLGYSLSQKPAEAAPEETFLAPIHEEHITRYYQAVHDPREPEAITPPPKLKVAIIIDDMGMDRKRGYELIKMDPALTLAFLPYAPELEPITQAALEQGHELMIHMPMQPEDASLDLGHIALRENMDEAALDQALNEAFLSFKGYVGMNNHMGSRLTQNPEMMDHVMTRLKEEGLYFVDSKTIATSIAGDRARDSGLETANRDIFLDHEESLSFVREALKRTEETAMRKGYAIAIGHPKDVTIEGLKEWIPTLEAKGIELVHASALVHKSPVVKPEPKLAATPETPQSQAQPHE